MKHTFHTLSLLSAMLLGAGSLSPSTALAQSSSLATPLGCATTGGWVYVAGTCDPQLRLQGRGTALWQKKLELKLSHGFTGNFVNGLPQGQGRLEGLEKYTRYSPTGRTDEWKISNDGGIAIPNLEFDKGEIVSREIQLSASRAYGRNTLQLKAQISTEDMFRLTEDSGKGHLAVDLGQIALTATYAHGQGSTGGMGFREAPVQISGRFRTGTIGPTRLAFDVDGELRTTGGANAFEYKGNMRVTCWNAICEIHFQGQSPGSRPESADKQTPAGEQSITYLGKTYTFIPGKVRDRVAYFAAPDGTRFDARIPECANINSLGEAGARLDTRGNRQPPTLDLSGACGHLTTPNGVDFKGTFDRTGKPVSN